ncbi:MAG: sigma 54-interacting transcriptional regulator [Acidobacteria bacterium]|nr:sigma 54-interacting transcriptional regulator [Acidobacteriota bacterium]
MNYLLYYIEGFIKKFPLDKPSITIGRSNDSDLVIKEDFISRKHVRITCSEKSIIVKDLGSTNGINFNGEKVTESSIKIGQSFTLGKMEFFLKKGTLDEFKLAKELIPIFNNINGENIKKSDNTKTLYIEDIYSETLKVVMQLGLKKNNFNEFILDLGNYLSNLTDFGSLFIISKQDENFDILLSVKNVILDMSLIQKIMASNPEVFTEKIISLPIEENNASLYASPLNIGHKNAALIFILNTELKKKKSALDSFLTSLVMEIELLAQLLPGKPPHEGKNIHEESGLHLPGDDDIVAESSHMRELIKQTKKIAAGDIFVLIQGESGTGKELFARLIHKYSGRDKEKFIAINCAAIPESLLESELFGHEKGAFTDAYTQKKGKLEIASGGTLVLDEIGDMPVNLQSKMLRALQEKKFYRVGGSVPITVDLRIISITNKDLKRLIAENKFREDLYYRLVHRIITIPPLRERKDDISALINFFTYKFCQQSNKKINGYSIKAFEKLQDYCWKGNIRQLENEIRSIVNLTDDGETVSYDILSDEIKENTEHRENTERLSLPDTKKFSLKMDPETEKTIILDLLEKNKGNKSQTARDINMTYRGLHKKMNKLGI